MKIRIERLEIEVPGLIEDILDFRANEGDAADKNNSALYQSIFNTMLSVLNKLGILGGDPPPSATPSEAPFDPKTETPRTETPGGAEPND